MDTERKIIVDIERNRVRVVVSHGEDEEIVKLSIPEARELMSKMQDAILDYDQRKQVRID
ncbi:MULTISPECIES: hypothetical protein [Methanococcoides]|jgi:predicted NBD/HSP70 family sugar kinase|uniref:NBD/HSP70 family sugar kinase n=1 Tax=Methanococcoides alaskense TaxID=325778 RepID=A0AA90TY77_9EURY|nr:MULTISPECIES: hypothetical protein [Methanococcoides]MDA0524597.1 hypothetical protein [Methanococcoides alaskense]MDR6222285.1 putative NBD/HSP70 family sugar kinase [Methanococcoides alaskense]